MDQYNDHLLPSVGGNGTYREKAQESVTWMGVDYHRLSVIFDLSISVQPDQVFNANTKPEHQAPRLS